MLSLTEQIIRQHTTDQVFRRGEDYYADGAVASVVRRGEAVYAEVQGSEPAPYRVSVTSGDDKIVARCSCPYAYEWDGWCKHIVATLLTALREPDVVELQPALEELLSELDRSQLQSLVLHLAEMEPGLYDTVAAHLAAAKRAAMPVPSATARRELVDARAVRRRVRGSLSGMRSSEAYWYVGSVVNDVRQILKEAEVLIEAGDGHNALAVLEAITGEYVDDWTELDDSDGEASAFFSELGSAWTEAVLSAELTPDEREQWREMLDAWDEEISQYGDLSFAAAREALEQGWDYPPLVRVLRGDLTDAGAWTGEAPWYADELTDARLNVLERQGRLEETLRLAEAEGRTALRIHPSEARPC